MRTRICDKCVYSKRCRDRELLDQFEVANEHISIKDYTCRDYYNLGDAFALLRVLLKRYGWSIVHYKGTYKAIKKDNFIFKINMLDFNEYLFRLMCNADLEHEEECEDIYRRVMVFKQDLSIEEYNKKYTSTGKEKKKKAKAKKKNDTKDKRPFRKRTINNHRRVANKTRKIR